MTASSSSTTALGRRLRLVADITAFEIGRQFRQPMIWVAGLILFALAVYLMSDEGFLGAGDALARNAPSEVGKAFLILSFFFVFVSVALAGDAALRDSASGFEAIIRATPTGRLARLLGRFLGLQVVVAFTFIAIGGGLLLGAAAPWTDQSAIGPFHWRALVQVLLFVAIPAVTTPAAIFFALAAWLRSTTAVYVAVVACVMILIIAPGMLQEGAREWVKWVAIVEPFGLVAFLNDGRLLDPAERALTVFAPGGLLVANRIFGLGTSALMVGVAFLRERRIDETRLPGSSSPEKAPPLATRPVASPRRFGAATLASQFLARARLEVRLLLRSPSLLILALLLIVGAVADLWSHNSLAGTPSLPATRVMADGLGTWMSIIALIVTAFYAGEIVWRERDRGVQDLVAASPVSDGVLLAAKAAAVGTVLLALLSAGVLAAVGVQVAKGYHDIRLDQYLTMAVVPVSLQTAFLGAFSIAAAALAPHRFAAWGLTVLLLGASMVTQAVGVSHPLFDPFSMPGAVLSEMNPLGDSATRGFGWVSAYWLCWGGVLLFCAWLFWRRGRDRPAGRILEQVGRRLRGPTKLLAGALVAGAVGLGIFIFVNLNVWNDFSTEREIEARRADYERELTPYLDRPEPSITAITMTVDIDPRRHRLVARGVYVIENRTGRPLERTHVVLPSSADEAWVSIDGARQLERRDNLGLATFAFDRPLSPGERRNMSFRTEIAPRGFGESGVLVVPNGTFVLSREIAPILGANREGFLSDADQRRRQGLPETAPMLEPDAPGARDRNYVRADLATLDISISTDASQTPIAPGRAVSDRTKDGRRTVRYVSDQPIRTYYAIQSARYDVRRVRHQGIDVAVYFHPGHGRNVNRMMLAMTAGLEAFQAEFGPYQFDYLRIVEFPAYGDYGQALPGTIAISENAGFIADLCRPDRFDYVTQLVLHELAHQWWAHQVVGADAKGALLLSEGLAAYVALQGSEAGNRALNQVYTEYYAGRAKRRGVEPPPARVEDQGYVAYERSALALLKTAAVIDYPILHRALRRFRDDHAFKGAPYPTSDDLIAAILAVTPVEKRPFVEAQFRTVTLPERIALRPSAARYPVPDAGCRKAR